MSCGWLPDLWWKTICSHKYGIYVCLILYNDFSDKVDLWMESEIDMLRFSSDQITFVHFALFCSIDFVNEDVERGLFTLAAKIAGNQSI